MKSTKSWRHGSLDTCATTRRITADGPSSPAAPRRELFRQSVLRTETGRRQPRRILTSKRAREAILARGGAARSNVFTRIALALFGQVPWRAVPFMPVELLLMPRWFPFHMSKVSYWSRTVVVPLLILCSLKPKAANPRKVDVRELFTTPPEEENNYSLPVPDSTCFSLAWIRWAAGWSRGYPAGCERPP